MRKKAKRLNNLNVKKNRQQTTESKSAKIRTIRLIRGPSKKTKHLN